MPRGRDPGSTAQVSDTHVCPTCGQPATRAFPPDDGFECRNEACPEFGQPLADVEPSPAQPPHPRAPDAAD